jgi:hypothetical protein
MSDISDIEENTQYDNESYISDSSDISTNIYEVCNELLEKTQNMMDEFYKNNETLMGLNQKIKDSDKIFVLYGHIGRVDIQDIIQEAHDISFKEIEEKHDITFGSKLIELLEILKD